MPVGELEGIEWQMRMFDSMPEEQQLAELRETLRRARRDAGADARRRCSPPGRRGDVERLARDAWTSYGDGTPAATPRSCSPTATPTWARWIQERLARPGTVFIAVGAGHLAGRDSVQAVLARARHHAERVPHVTAHWPT